MKKLQKNQESKVKAPKTIRVKTLIIVILWVLSLAGAVTGGWMLRSADNARVTQEAQAMVQSLSKASK